MRGEANPWDTLLVEMGTREKDARDRLLTGQCATLEQYREEVGYLRALGDVKAKIAEIFKRDQSPFVER